MINYWLAIDDTIHSDIVDYYADPENYSGDLPVDHIVMFTTGVIDFKTVVGLFKVHNTKHLYTVYVSDQEVFDMLLAAYPTTEVLGSWTMDGTRVDEITEDTINYMPDVWDGETEESIPATELTDVNLLSGQGQRDFS